MTTTQAQAARNATASQTAGFRTTALHDIEATLGDQFRGVDGSTHWQLTETLQLNFATFHTQGIATTTDFIFLSAVEVLEPTVTHQVPIGGFDRTPGRGIGHLFVIDRGGNLRRDILLGVGDMYHPGGIDFDGTNIWIPVAQYRPHSSSIIYRVDSTTFDVVKQFDVQDHVGGVVMDRHTGHLVGHTWGSRRFAEWNLAGKQLRTWANPNFFIDYQDGQYVSTSKMLCAGVTHLPQTPSAGGSTAVYELGGIALIDINTQTWVHGVPFQHWSTGGHVATRNPFTMTARGDRLIVRVAPDNGDEANGTQILTYEAEVNGAGQPFNAARLLTSSKANIGHQQSEVASITPLDTHRPGA